MTEDSLWIENHRYLKEAFWVLPLPSGKIAVLTPRRELFQIVGSWDEAKKIGPLAQGEPPKQLSLPTLKLRINL